MQQQQRGANWSRLRQQQYPHQLGATTSTAEATTSATITTKHLPAATRSAQHHRSSDCISFIGYSCANIGYQGNTYLQLLVQQHLRHLQHRQLQLLLIRQQHTTIWRAASSGNIKSVYPTHTGWTLCINLRDISTRTPTSFYVSTIEPTPSTLSTGVRGGLAITNSDIRSDTSSCIDRLSLQLEAANTRSKSMYGYMAVDTRRQQSTGSIFYTAGGSFWGEAPSIYPRNRGLTLRYSHAIVARRPSRNTGRFAPSHRRKLKLQQGRYPSANKPKFAFSSLDHLTRAECTVVY